MHKTPGFVHKMKPGVFASAFVFCFNARVFRILIIQEELLKDRNQAVMIVVILSDDIRSGPDSFKSIFYFGHDLLLSLVNISAAVPRNRRDILITPP